MPIHIFLSNVILAQRKVKLIVKYEKHERLHYLFELLLKRCA